MSNDEKLAEAWSGTVSPYSQIKDSLGITADDAGQFDFVVGSLKPETGENNGLYCIVGEFPVTAPSGFAFPYKRTLWIGSKKDKMAEQPSTRLNSPGLRFLRAIAKANNVPTNDQSDAALCAAITGRAFGCRIEATTYEGRNIDPTTGKLEVKKGTEFGRNVTPAGLIPAKLDKQKVATPLSNGSIPAGTQFASE